MSYAIVPAVSPATLSAFGPRHEHDCDCAFVGRMDRVGHPDENDVYYCEGTLIIRKGSEGPDYASFPVEVARMAAEQSGKGEFWSDAVLCLDLWAKAVGKSL